MGYVGVSEGNSGGELRTLARMAKLGLRVLIHTLEMIKKKTQDISDIESSNGGFTIGSAS